MPASPSLPTIGSSGRAAIDVRLVSRDDRDQLTDLVNAHVAAVIPNMSISVATLMARLEREPGEPIEDPWVVERQTLVAIQRSRLVAAAHLVRFSAASEAPPGVRDSAGVRWLVYWPAASYWPDSDAAAEKLITACLALLRRWAAARTFADGSLPALGVYGLPDSWPHVVSLVQSAGFFHDGQTERVLGVLVDRLADLPASDVAITRSLGVNGVRFSPTGRPDLYLEVDTTLEAVSRTGRLGEWADVGNFTLSDGSDRAALAAAMLRAAGRWLQLGGVRCLLDYALVDQPGRPSAGDDHTAEPWYPFELLTTTRRGWTLPD